MVHSQRFDGMLKYKLKKTSDIKVYLNNDVLKYSKSLLHFSECNLTEFVILLQDAKLKFNELIYTYR